MRLLWAKGNDFSLFRVQKRAGQGGTSLGEKLKMMGLIWLAEKNCFWELTWLAAYREKLEERAFP